MHAQHKITPLNVLDDAVLMKKLQEGQTDKLGLLFERYHQRMFAFFMRLTSGNQSLSEDLVQNTFFRILKYKKSYNPEKKFSTWIYQVGRNVFFDHCRKGGNENSVDDFKSNEPVDEMVSPFQETDERLDLLRMALDQLPEDKREIIVLSRYEGLRYKEIGEIMDCSETAIKVKAHRAMKELKDIYLKIEKSRAV